MNALYIVTAYRYGMRDAHSYVVGAWTDLAVAKAAADSEVEYRGGKYGCEVVESNSGPAWTEQVRVAKQVYYVESPYFGMLGLGNQPADISSPTAKEKSQELRIDRVKSARGRLDDYAENAGLEIKTAEGFDDCIIGVAMIDGDARAVYSRTACATSLVLRDKISIDDAEEHIDHNLVGSHVPHGPVFVDQFMP